MKGMKLKAKSWNAKHFRLWMRKGNCPGCNAGCGSEHEPGCWARRELLESITGKLAEIPRNCPKTITGNHIWDDEVYRWKKGDMELIPKKVYKKCRACGIYDDR